MNFLKKASIENIEILKEIDEFFEYQLPQNLIGIIWKGKFRGQKQKWFIARFTGNEKEINLKTKNPEYKLEMGFPDELPNIIVDFKKDMYLRLLEHIKKIIK